MGIVRQTLLKRLTELHNDSPDQAVRPFDADASGTVVGEGGGLFIIEEYEHAKKRGARMYAELVALGQARTPTAFANPIQQATAIQRRSPRR